MGGSRAAPVMGLPPLDPRSKSKNMAMKLMNKIGNKQPNKKLHGGDAPKYPGTPFRHMCSDVFVDCCDYCIYAPTYTGAGRSPTCHVHPCFSNCRF